MASLEANARHGSLWLETAALPEFAPLDNDLKVEVAVLGGGITGVTTALLLQEAGIEVALVEAARIGHGVTGHTTAKLTSLHGLRYASFVKSTGEDAARAYGEANETGIDLIREKIERFGIDCDYRDRDNYTYTESESERGKIEAEVEVARRLRLPAELVNSVDLPFPVAGAVRFSDQAEFHPLKYLAGLTAQLTAGGARVFEGTRAMDVSDGSPCRIKTNRNATVEADRVIVATSFPFLDRGLFFARQHPSRSYVVACKLEGEAPEGMYLSTESSAHSIRSHRLDGEELLLVGGEGHKVGQEDEPACFERLAGWARERFPVKEIVYRWSAQDNMSADGMPLVGKLTPFSDRILTATGYGKWGLAAGSAAALLLRDLAQGAARRPPWAFAFDTSRLRPRAAASKLVKENADVAKHFVVDRIRDRVGAGRAPRCTHLGCVLAWNEAEESWDCPCHGSRFGADGNVLQGPAVSPIDPPPGRR